MCDSKSNIEWSHFNNILLSDGNPNDFDRYEGKYGIKDIKQSLKEIHAQVINAYALAIEA
jgi:nitric oxide reductase NorD protein